MQKFFAIVLTFILASCAAKLPYSTDFPLTQKSFHSRDGLLTGKIPQGWFSSTEDTLAPSLQVWLVRDDLFASISIKELKLDSSTKQQVEKEGLELLARISSGFNSDAPNIKIEPQEFKLRGKAFCSYELNYDNIKKRVVVFSINWKYYECTAGTLKGSWSAFELSRMFTAQQTVLASISY